MITDEKIQEILERHREAVARERQDQRDTSARSAERALRRGWVAESTTQPVTNKPKQYYRRGTLVDDRSS